MPEHFVSFGNLDASHILDRASNLVYKLLQQDCKIVVVACNTATNVGLANVYSDVKVPFVGCEPAIKPAAIDGCNNILVLTTVATSQQDKFVMLKDRYNSMSNIVVAPQVDLARLIEFGRAGQNLRQNILSGNYALPQDFYRDLCSQLYNKVCMLLDEYDYVDGVVLGCTHYVFLRPLIQQYCNSRNRDIAIFDGNDGIAKHTMSQLQYVSK
jgi:glutamate racemase